MTESGSRTVALADDLLLQMLIHSLSSDHKIHPKRYTLVAKIVACVATTKYFRDATSIEIKPCEILLVNVI